MGRTDEERKKIFRFELVDVVIARAIAGTINASILIMAAVLFHANGLTGVGDIDLAYEALCEQVITMIPALVVLAIGLHPS